MRLTANVEEDMFQLKVTMRMFLLVFFLLTPFTPSITCELPGRKHSCRADH